MKRNRYHSSFIIRYKLSMLSAEELAAIPRSTRHYWDKQNYLMLVGSPEKQAQEQIIPMKKIFKTLRCILIAFFSVSNLLDAIKQKQKYFRENRKMIVETIGKLAQEIRVEKACQLMQVSVQRYYLWKNEKRCTDSFANLCRKSFPQQLTAQEIKTVKDYLTDPTIQLLPLISVYYKMMRDEAAFMSKQTFYRCARALGMTRKRRKKVKSKTGIRATRPLQLLHIDVTVFRLPDSTRIYIQLITDNFSKAIIGCRASLKWCAKESAENVRQVCEQYGLYNKQLQLMCDNGSENQGALNLFLEQPNVQIEKVVAQLDTHFSNSMAEAANKRAKYYYLFAQHFTTFQQLVNYLPKMLEQENKRYHYGLYGHTPNEVLAGAIPDKRFFTSQIKQASAYRRMLNRVTRCKVC